MGYSISDENTETNASKINECCPRCLHILYLIKNCILSLCELLFCRRCFEHKQSNSTSSDHQIKISNGNEDNYPKPTAYHRPFYVNAGIMNTYHNKPQVMNERTPLKTAYLMDINRISKEIYYGLQGNSFWNILFENVYSFLLIGSIVICNLSIYALLMIPNIAIDGNILSFKWKCGLIYIPMQLILFICYPLIIKWSKQNNSSSSHQNRVYLLIIGIFLLSLSIAGITLIDNIYLLVIIFSIQGLSLSFIFGAFTDIFTLLNSRKRRKKPILSILTIANRFGYVIGSLVGGKLREYFNEKQTFLILAAAVLLYSPFLIALLRETNHKNVLFNIEQDSSEDCTDDDDDDESEPILNNTRAIVQMVDSSDSISTMSY